EWEAAVGWGRGAVGLPKRFENDRQRLGRNADAGVDHLDLDTAVARARGHRDAALFREFEGVDDQVFQYHLQLDGVGVHRRYVRRDRPLATHRGLLQLACLGRQLVQQPAQTDDLQIEVHAAGLETAEVERGVDQMKQLLGALGHALHGGALRVAQRAELFVEKQAAVAADDIQRGTQLVRHRRDKFRFDAVGA